MKPKVTLKRNKPRDGQLWSYTSTHTEQLPTGGESVSLDEIAMLDDGALTISSDGSENFVYLYPAQVEQLRKLLCAK